MHNISPDAGGFGNPAFMLPASTKDIESKPVEDTTNTGREPFGSGETADDTGRELGM